MTRALPVVLVIAAFSASAPAAEDGATEDSDACPALQAATRFVADATGRRHDGSANKLTESHQNAEGQGWDFADLEIYIENGDLQGFFVTYTRPHPCNSRLPAADAQ